MKNVIYQHTGLECPAKLICQPKYALWGEILSKSSFLISCRDRILKLTFPTGSMDCISSLIFRGLVIKSGSRRISWRRFPIFKGWNLLEYWDEKQAFWPLSLSPAGSLIGFAATRYRGQPPGLHLFLILTNLIVNLSDTCTGLSCLSLFQVWAGGGQMVAVWSKWAPLQNFKPLYKHN